MNLQTSQETVSFSDWSVRIFTLHLNECFYLQTFSSLTILPRFLVVLFAKRSTQSEPRWSNLNNLRSSRFRFLQAKRGKCARALEKKEQKK